MGKMGSIERVALTNSAAILVISYIKTAIIKTLGFSFQLAQSALGLISAHVQQIIELFSCTQSHSVEKPKESYEGRMSAQHVRFLFL